MAAVDQTLEQTTQLLAAQAEQLSSAQRVQLIEWLLRTLVPVDATTQMDIQDLWAVLRRRLILGQSPALLRSKEDEQVRIVHTEGVCGGSARVGNTRIPVWSLVASRRLGASDEQLLRNYPSLTREHLQAAWSYYEGHQDEIEQDIASQDEP